MKIKFKKIKSDAVTPTKAHDTDAGFDLVATSVRREGKFIEYGTGISFDIPKGYVGLIYPRSSITKIDMMLKNSVGVIDSGYQGEIKFRFHSTFIRTKPLIAGGKNPTGTHYNVGDRIGQIIFQKLPEIELEETTEFSETERGEGGFGSTGK